MSLASAIIGALRVNLGMDSAAFSDGATDAERRLQQFQRNMQSVSARLTRAGSVLSAAVTVPLIALATKAVDAAAVQERAIASVAQVLTTMGDGAGYSLNQLTALASEMQGRSLFGDEEILSKVTANLLTFGNVSGEVFPRAQQLALDLSARLGNDLQSSAIMVGKALNDPIAGLSALSEVGVSFTEQQKEQIRAMAEVGNLAGAQAIMLAELERQYGGQAEAMANTDSGKITQAWNAIGDAMERVGAIILPVLADFAVKVKEAAEWFQTLNPDVQRWSVIALAAAAAMGPLLLVAGGLAAVVAKLAPLIVALVSPFTLAAVAVGVFAFAIWKNWDYIKTEYPAITTALETVGGAISSLVAAMGEFSTSASPAMQQGASALAAHLESVMAGDLRGAFTSMVDFVQGFARTILAAFDTLTLGVSSKVNQMVVGLHRDAYRVIIDSTKATWQAIVDLWNRIVTFVTTWPAKMMEIGGQMIDGLRAGIAAKLEDFKAYWEGFGQSFIEGTKDLFRMQSPSRVFAEIGDFIMQGLGLGIAGGVAPVVASMRSAGERMSAAMLQASDLSAVGLGLSDVADAADGLAARSDRAFAGVGRWLADLTKGATTLRDTLADALDRQADGLWRSGGQGVQSWLSGAVGGGGFGSLLAGFAGNLMGFKDGGRFEVGGIGGIDSQIVNFRATPGEIVNVTKPGQTGGSPMDIRLVVESTEDLRVVSARYGAGAGARAGQNIMVQEAARAREQHRRD